MPIIRMPIIRMPIVRMPIIVLAPYKPQKILVRQFHSEIDAMLSEYLWVHSFMS